MGTPDCWRKRIRLGKIPRIKTACSTPGAEPTATLACDGGRSELRVHGGDVVGLLQLLSWTGGHLIGGFGEFRPVGFFATFSSASHSRLA